MVTVPQAGAFTAPSIRKCFKSALILLHGLILHKAVLGHKQVIVRSFVQQQFFMASAFLNLAFIHIQDARTVLDGGKTVGDDEGGTSFQQLVQAFLQDDFRFGIDAGGRLIQNQYFRVGQQCAGKGNQLALSCGKPASAFIYLGIIAVLHLHDEVMGAYGFRSQDYFIVRSRPVAVADVIHNRSGENEAVLHHDAHLRAQGMQRHLEISVSSI